MFEAKVNYISFPSQFSQRVRSKGELYFLARFLVGEGFDALACCLVCSLVNTSVHVKSRVGSGMNEI